MVDMKKKAEDILEDFTYSYSQVDLETLAKFLWQIKSEAYKEFAERVKEYGFIDQLSLDGERIVYVKDIDLVLEELQNGVKE